MNKTTKIILIVGAVVIAALAGAGVALAQAETPVAPGFGRGADGPLHTHMEAAVAAELGISVEDLTAAHDAGKTAWDLAEAKGMTETEFTEAMTRARTAALAAAVKAGDITQEQADFMAQRWQQREEMRMNGADCQPGSMGPRGQGGDFAGRGGRGMRWQNSTNP